MIPDKRYRMKTLDSVGTTLNEWTSFMHKFTYGVWFPLVIREKSPDKFSKKLNDMIYYCFPFLTGGPQYLPSETSFKPIRWVREAKNVPDIGDNLNAMLRSYPIAEANCYYWSLLTSLSVPGVDIVRGVYPMSQTIQKKIESNNLSDIEYHQNIRSYFGDKDEKMSKRFSHFTANWWKNCRQYFFKDSKGRLWTPHAWSIYDGIHFDMAFPILKKRMYPRNWHSKNKNKWIYWTEYKMDAVVNRDKLIKKFNVTQNDIQVIKHLCAVIWFDFIRNEVVNRRYGNTFRFPVNRKWMKAGFPFPDFNPNETKQALQFFGITN